MAKKEIKQKSARKSLLSRILPSKLYGVEDRTLKAHETWDFYYSNILDKNLSQKAVTKQYNVYADFVGIYSNLDKVTFLYVIDDFPTEIENSFANTLRRECSNDVRLSLIHIMSPHYINWNSPRNKNRFKSWREIDNVGNDEEVDAFNYFEVISASDSREFRASSLIYMSDATKRRNRTTLKRRSMVILSGKRGLSFDEAAKNIELKCTKMGIKLRRVIDDVPEFLSAFSPFNVSNGETSILKRVNSFIWTDEVIARMSSYAEGTVGKGSVYFGTDIFSNFPVAKEVKRDSTDAENWLFTAITGGGKSYYTKGILSQLLASKYMNGTINDFEGNEYQSIGYTLEAGGDLVVTLDLSERSKTYFDPVEIYTTGDLVMDDLMYDLSTSITLAMFKTLVGKKIGAESSWVETILETQVAVFYASLNVFSDDISSWVNTRGKTIQDVYKTILEYKPKDDNALEAYNKIVARLDIYFGETGRRAGYFINRVTIDEIKDAKLVINSFGMRGKSEGTVSAVAIELMQLYAALISQLRSIFSLAQGKFNFKVWEEFQRYSSLPDAEKIITPALTGGRKNGDINIIITNKPGELIKEDKFGIFETITTFAIGAVGDAHVRAELCKRLSIPTMTVELDKIEENTSKDLTKGEDNDTMTSIYSKAFLVGLDKADYTVVKMQIPKYLSDSEMYKTGVQKGAKI